MKFRKLILASLLAPFATTAFGEELLAGSDSTPVGTVTVTKDGGVLEVSFETTDPLLIFEAHADAGQIDEGYCDVPQTRKGNPKVGKFEKTEEVGVSGASSLTLNVTNDFEDGETICVAAHAVVYDPSLAESEDEEIIALCDSDDEDLEVSEEEAFWCSEETAWGDGPAFDGSSWATWIEYCIPGDNDVVNTVDIGDAGNLLNSASDVSLDGDGDASVTGSVGFCDDADDFYAFTAPASGALILDLTEMEGDLDLYLWESGGGAFLLASSISPGTTDEAISVEVQEGTNYIIQVNPYLSAASGYELTIDAPAAESLLTCPCWSTFTEEGLIAALDAEEWLIPSCQIIEDVGAIAYDFDGSGGGFLWVSYIEGICMFQTSSSDSLSDLTDEQVDVCFSEASSVMRQLENCDDIYEGD